MNDIKQMAALTALNKMMQDGWLSICTIDTIGTMLGINPKCEAYTILHTLHCVHFEKMPAEMRAEIPGLIKACLSMESTYQFAAPKIKVVPPVETKVEPEKSRGLMRLLGGRS